MTQPAQQARNQPERKFGPYPGGVGVAVWINTIETDQGAKNIRSITINPRRYFDNTSQQWKDSRSFRPEDLPALIFGLQKALEHCYLEPISGQDTGDGAAPDDTPF
ncbi:MAG: hypothetical protein Tsb009_38930 [Planctomycetaceae bacterium]